LFFHTTTCDEKKESPNYNYCPVCHKKVVFEYVRLAPQLPMEGRIPNEVVCVPDLAGTYPQLEYV
jgi:hypothetical protein